MPIYEYACDECGAEFEAEQRITEDPLKTHDACGGPVRRLISRTAFTLKGGGWYSDHYGLKSKGNGKNGASGEAKAESKGETKTDAGPAAKTGGEKKADTKSPTGGKAA